MAKSIHLILEDARPIAAYTDKLAAIGVANTLRAVKSGGLRRYRVKSLLLDGDTKMVIRFLARTRRLPKKEEEICL